MSLMKNKYVLIHLHNDYVQLQNRTLYLLKLTFFKYEKTNIIILPKSGKTQNH